MGLLHKKVYLLGQARVRIIAWAAESSSCIEVGESGVVQKVVASGEARTEEVGRQ